MEHVLAVDRRHPRGRLPLARRHGLANVLAGLKTRLARYGGGVPLVAIGCNHRSTPIEMLERMTVRDDDMPKALADLRSAEQLTEAVVLSTCNRVEIYASVERFHGGYRDVREFLCRHSGLPPENVADHLYALYDTSAVEHLFRVTAGLDSAVIGEHEILGQVRGAADQARIEGTLGNTLAPLFRHAVECGKRVRTETAIGRGIASVSQAAVALAAAHLGGLEGRSVLLLGAGEMAKGAVKSLTAAKAAVLVANRTPARAEALASTAGGRVVPLDRLADALGEVDVVLAATGASELILDRAALAGREAVPAGRGEAVPASRELVIVDIGVPRNVDPDAGELAGVTLLDMEAIGEFIERTMRGRQGEVVDTESIVVSEVARFEALNSAREVAPLVAQLHARGDEVVATELERFRSRLGGLEPAQRQAVEALAHGVAQKLLRSPTVRVKDAAGKARGERLAESLRDLFDL